MNRERIINPKRPGHFKGACHALMDETFGTTAAGRKKAYQWLAKNFGGTIHFSQLNDEAKLREIWEELYKQSFKLRE